MWLSVRVKGIPSTESNEGLEEGICAMYYKGAARKQVCGSDVWQVRDTWVWKEGWEQEDLGGPRRPL